MWIYEVRSNVQVQVRLSLVLYSAAQPSNEDMINQSRFKGFPSLFQSLMC
jgi:hypothetical protein